MKALILTVKGETEVVEFTNDTCYVVLSHAVGGYIECIHLPHLDVNMWINEEGKIHDLPTNAQATLMWVKSYGPTDAIMGNVIFTSHTDVNGNTVGLTDEQVVKIKSDIVDLMKVTIISLDDFIAEL